MSDTIADRVIEFLGRLQGMDRLQSPLEQPRKAAIDLNTAAIIEVDPEFPDGELLLYERADGAKLRVSTSKLIEQLFVRHAYEISVTEGCSIKDEYKHISDHFLRKTGFGQ